MYREIKKKRLILDNRRPYRKEVEKFIKEIHYIDWIYSSLKLNGSGLTKNEVEKILKGNFITEVSVQDHRNVINYKAAIDLCYYMIEMGYYLNEDFFLRLNKALTEEHDSTYRKNNPVLRMISYNPPHFKEIGQQMEIMFDWLHSSEIQNNPLEKAAVLHNRIIEIYPFPYTSESMARIAAQYHLISNGLPPIYWEIGEQEYYEAVLKYLRNEDIQPIYDVIQRGVFNKLEVMMQLTAE